MGWLQKLFHLPGSEKEGCDTEVKPEPVDNIARTAAHERQAITHLESHDYASAIDRYTSCIELNPDDARYYEMRGALYSALCNYDCAIADFSKLIELEGSSPSNYEDRADLYVCIEDYTNAIADYSKAIELFPCHWYFSSRGDAHNAISNLPAATEDYDRAIDWLTEYLNENPNDCRVYRLRAVHFIKKADYGNAIADCSKAIELNGDCPWLYLCRGMAHNMLGNNIEGEKDLQKACLLDPDLLQDAN